MITSKTVNVYPKRPIMFGKSEIRGVTKKIELSTGNIFHCLLAMAKVEEVLKDGSTIELTRKNYKEDFSKSIAAKPLTPATPTPTPKEASATTTTPTNIAKTDDAKANTPKVDDAKTTTDATKK